MSESSNSCVGTENLSARVNLSWFLGDGEYEPKISSFEALINGEAAFGRLYKEIEAATRSVEIAIWGFQPSMFFKRDGQSLCIGDLLVKKAMDGVKVKVLAWSMLAKVQTFMEANLGNDKSIMKNNSWQTQEQTYYDTLWYDVMEKKRSINFRALENTIYAKSPLQDFYQSSEKSNLIFETRSAKSTIFKHYHDKVSLLQRLVLAVSATHHQKTVLIDYTDPKLARGFVLEHNMLDNYWDSNEHLASQEQVALPHQGRNAGPLQDVSSFVRGPILHAINSNFCQSWDRVVEEKITPQRQALTVTDYALTTEPNRMMLQALRTYDQPQVEQIKELYLQNIKKTTSYIYTENQYFRWSSLVEKFKTHWQAMKAAGRADPIYWFVVTNSSDEGIGSGTINTDKMFELLGRQDVMPGVAIKRSKELRKQQKEYKNKKLQEQQAAAQLNGGSVSKAEPALDGQGKPLDSDPDFSKTLKKDLSDEIGIKAHICVLSAKDSWEEVYVHSKVTIINDTFVTMGSANINSRSMQTDSEFNLALECGATAQKLRKDLWGLHVNDAEANPNNLSSPAQAEAVFDQWQVLLDANKDFKRAKQKPKQPLTEFLRTSSELSDKD